MISESKLKDYTQIDEDKASEAHQNIVDNLQELNDKLRKYNETKKNL